MISGIHLHEDLKKAFLELGFQEMTEIQQKAIPLIQQGKDVIGQSMTGSGKTAAFGFPLLEKISHNGGLQALVLVPTRELCEQVMSELRKFSKYKRLNITAIYGGVSINPQFQQIRNADVIVGTPGRILDHLQRGTLNLRKLAILVLDEADKMFEMGFIEDVRTIVSQTPKERQTLLFSATMSTQVHEIVRHYMKNPEKVKVQSYVEEHMLPQFYYSINSRDKFSLLVHILKHENPSLAIIFCATRRRVDIVSKNLESNGINAIAIHGGLSQNQRKRAIDMFHSGSSKILVASDVAARGLDIKNISHIFNYDIPKTSKEYIHRIGRTARAGAEGKVISILSEEDHENMRAVLEDRSITIQHLPVPEFPRVGFMPYIKRESFGHGRPHHQRGRSGEGYGRRPSHGGVRVQYASRGRRFSSQGSSQSSHSGERKSYSSGDRPSYGQSRHRSQNRGSYQGRN
ncbi:DEAD/DEAH box helicase [Candidatus Woesearchaeota archaeon]|nr:DEAD/DEAH box helicase [Candidatus Woesearchaeota archaeon]